MSRRERVWLRTRATLAAYRTPILVVCLIVAGVGGLAAHTAYVDPGTQTTERTTAQWTTQGSFDHSATVTRENPLFRVGRVLPNQRAYFPAVTPIVNGTHRFSYDAESGGANVTTRATLAVESVDDETVFWQRRSRLGSFSQANVPPGRAVELPFSVNISRTADVIERVRETVGRTPGDVRVVVRTTTTYEGTIEGETARRSRTDQFVLVPSDAAFRVDETGGGETTDRVTTRVTQPAAYGPPRRLGGPLALFVGLLAAGLVAALDPEQLALSASERRRRQFLAHRREYAEWLSTVSPPATADDRAVAAAATLADLVDFAIDSDNGVLFDRANDRYVVLDGETLYVYEPPPATDGFSLADALDDTVAALVADATPANEAATTDGKSEETPEEVDAGRAAADDDVTRRADE